MAMVGEGGDVAEAFQHRKRWDSHRLKAPFFGVKQSDSEAYNEARQFCAVQLAYGPHVQHGTVLYVSGVTPLGHSISVIVRGYHASFYIKCHASWTDVHVERLVDALEREMRVRIDRGYSHAPGDEVRYGGGVEAEELFETLDNGDDGDDDDDGEVDHDAMSPSEAKEHEKARFLKRLRKTNKKREKRVDKNASFFGGVGGNGGFGSSKEEKELYASRPFLIDSCEVLAGTSFTYYRGKGVFDNFLKITVCYPKLVSLCRTILEGSYVENEQSVKLPDTKWLEVYPSLAPADPTHGTMFELFEAHVDYTINFTAMRQLRMCTWWCLPDVRDATAVTFARRRVTTTDYELEVPYELISSVPATRPGLVPGSTLQTMIPNCLAMMFDIECVNLQGRFPSALFGDPVVIISFTIYRLSNYALRKNYVLVVLPQDDPTLDLPPQQAGEPELIVIVVKTVLELLELWREMVIGLDADVMAGYNSNSFDIMYLKTTNDMLHPDGPLARMQWDAKKERARWLRMGRMPLTSHSLFASKPRVTRGKSKVDVRMGGRCILDFMRWAVTPGPEKEFVDLRLGGVAQDIVGQTKADMPPDRISHAYRLNASTRGRLVNYASIDTELLYEMDKKRKIILEYMEQASRRGITPQEVHDRGTEHSVQAGLYFFMRTLYEKDLAAHAASVARGDSEAVTKELVALPCLLPTRRRDRPFIVLDKFEGAIVREPTRGFYTEPVFTLDARSLYPSVILQNNMCPTTMFTDPTLIAREGLVEGRDFTRRPKVVRKHDGEMAYDHDTKRPRHEPISDESSACYLTATYKPSIVCAFLNDLFALRVSYKKTMAKAIGEREALDALIGAREPTGAELVQRAQLELQIDAARRQEWESTIMICGIREVQVKLLMNSTYGYFGSLTSPGSNPQLAADVTWWGRYLSSWAGYLLESHFCKKAGFKYDCIVIYGDTDSIMIRIIGCPDDNGATVKWVAEIASTLINSYMPKPHAFIYEKYYLRMLLRGKKMYAGLKFTPGQAKPKLEIKGMSVVKKDYCPLVRRVVKKALYDLIVEGNTPLALKNAQYEIGLLKSGEFDLSELIMSKSLSSNPDKYKVKNKAGRTITLLPHVQLALRMMAAEPRNPPRAGDRISSVLCMTTVSTSKDKRKQTKGDQAVAPMVAFREKIPINIDHYMSTLETELGKVFESVLGGSVRAKHLLFTGRHMLKRRQTEISALAPLAKFMRIEQHNCEGCHHLLPTPTKTSLPLDKLLCDKCQLDGPSLRDDAARRLSEAKARRDECLRECQNCVAGENASAEMRNSPIIIEEIAACASEACKNQWRRLRAKADVDAQQKKWSRWLTIGEDDSVFEGARAKRDASTISEIDGDDEGAGDGGEVVLSAKRQRSNSD